MNEDFLHEIGWKSTWDKNVWIQDKMLLWLPVDRDETIITTENNYGNVLFKGIIHTNEELSFITKLLTKTDES